MRKHRAVVIENPNNLKPLNDLFDEGYELQQTTTVKNNTVFILTKWENDAETELRGPGGIPVILGRETGVSYTTESGAI